MNKLSTILKIMLITTVVLTGFTYFIAPKPKSNTQKQIINKLTYAQLPKHFELVGSEGLIAKEKLIKQGEKTIIAIANLDALVIINQLEDHFKINFNYLTAANISNAPWFIKKVGVLPTLEKINKQSKTTMIYDYNGWLAKSLRLNDIDPTKYFIYKITENGDILFLFEGAVPFGAIDGQITDEEKKKILQNIMTKLEGK